MKSPWTFLTLVLVFPLTGTTPGGSRSAGMAEPLPLWYFQLHPLTQPE